MLRDSFRNSRLLFSPHELVFGRIAREPLHEPIVEENLELTYKEYLEDLNNKLFQIQALVYENLTQTKAKSKEHYEKNKSSKF